MFQGELALDILGVLKLHPIPKTGIIGEVVGMATMSTFLLKRFEVVVVGIPNIFSCVLVLLGTLHKLADAQNFSGRGPSLKKKSTLSYCIFCYGLCYAMYRSSIGVNQLVSSKQVISKRIL